MYYICIILIILIMIYERGVAASCASGTPTPSLVSLFNHTCEYMETRARESNVA